MSEFKKPKPKKSRAKPKGAKNPMNQFIYDKVEK